MPFEIPLLIPESTGYAVDGDGNIYKLSDPPAFTSVTGTTLTGVLSGNRPTYAVHQSVPQADRLIIIADGGPPVKIVHGSTVAAALGGSPPQAKFVDVLDTRVILSGFNDMDFVWSEEENAEDYVFNATNTTEPWTNFNRVLADGEKIKMMKVYNRDIFFFKTHSIEIWTDVGGDLVFARRDFINLGGKKFGKTDEEDENSLVGDSVIFANGAFFFYCNGDFYALQGNRPQNISRDYRKYLDKLKDKQGCYGFDYRKESLIRWFFPNDHKCIVFDYARGTWSEDNEWQDGHWRRMRHYSYMELQGEQYVGDINRTGKIYHWDRKYQTDDGQEVRVYRDFQFILGDGQDFRVNRLRIRMERGVATAMDGSDVEGADPVELDPLLFLRWRFDKGVWAYYEHRSMGKRGEYDPWIDVWNLGIGRELELEFVETDAVKYLITHAQITAEPLGR